MSTAIRFGVLGAARITPAALVYPAESIADVRIDCVGARDRARAEVFAAEHRIPEVLDDYAAVIAADVDAIYVPLPISEHLPWTLAALEAGKHVLCEKALGCNAAEARRMHDAARASGCVLMEAFHYRYHPLFQRVVELVASDAIGALREVQASFCVPHIPVTDIRYDFALGGGALMDLGCYPVHWLRHASGREPEVVMAQAVTGPEEVDVSLDAELRLPAAGGLPEVRARLRCSMAPEEPMVASLRLEGDDGVLEVDNPLAPQMGHELRLQNAQGALRETVDRTPTYLYQLEAFAAAVRGAPTNLTDGADAVRTMQVIDALYGAAGLRLRGT